MEGIGVQILGFIFALSLLVLLHELGHFIPAKLFKTRVEKFYLFFNPKFSLFKFKKGDTEYGIGWLPLGGYVKIAGMIDESMDKEQMAKDPEPWEFRSKPAWQRLIIMLGGVTVNAILAWFIYSMMFLNYGNPVVENPDHVNIVKVNDEHILFKTIGLKTNDQVLEVDGDEVVDISDFFMNLHVFDQVTVKRGNEIITLQMPENIIDLIKADTVNQISFSDRFTFSIGRTFPGSEAEQVGFQAGDRIIEAGNQPVMFFDEFNEIKQNFRNDSMSIKFQRGDELISSSVYVNDSMMIGFEAIRDIKIANVGLFESFGLGYDKTVRKLKYYAQGFKKILNPESGLASSVGGFRTISKLFPTEWSWYVIWERTAFLSIVLAFMNLLPIPALDGGHVMFLLYEIIARRKPGEKFMERAQMVGMIILISMMVLANLNDTVFQLFR